LSKTTCLKKVFLPFALLVLVLASGCQTKPATAPADPPAAPVSQAAVEYWQTQFPAQVASYLRTKEEEATAFAGSVPYQKLDAYPFMRTMYHGFGFWFDFRESRGHMYTIEDTLVTGRPKFGAACVSAVSLPTTRRWLQNMAR